MDVEKIVQNIQRICRERGTTPTVACKESGAGQNTVTYMKKHGTIPSVEKMSLLASYLGVTTSELLGEEKEPTPCPGLTAKEAAVIDQYRSKPDLQPAVDILLGITERSTP